MMYAPLQTLFWSFVMQQFATGQIEQTSIGAGIFTYCQHAFLRVGDHGITAEVRIRFLFPEFTFPEFAQCIVHFG